MHEVLRVLLLKWPFSHVIYQLFLSFYIGFTGLITILTFFTRNLPAKPALFALVLRVSLLYWVFPHVIYQLFLSFCIDFTGLTTVLLFSHVKGHIHFTHYLITTCFIIIVYTVADTIRFSKNILINYHYATAISYRKRKDFIPFKSSAIHTFLYFAKSCAPVVPVSTPAKSTSASSAVFASTTLSPTYNISVFLS